LLNKQMNILTYDTVLKGVLHKGTKVFLANSHSTFKASNRTTIFDVLKNLYYAKVYF